jgi:putative RecB family exonuclease
MTPETSVPTTTASKLTTYLQCPRKYRFRYVLRLPTEFRASGLAFGSSVHAGLQIFHEARRDGHEIDIETVLRRFRADCYAEFSGNLRFKEGETKEGLLSLGETLIRQYVETFPGVPVTAVEEPFQVPLADPATGEVFGPDLRGIFDLVLSGDTVGEIKTAARAYDEGTLQRHVQLSAYAYAFRVRHGRDPKLLVVALLKQKRPRIETMPAARTIDDDAWFVSLAAEVVRGIEAGIFPPNPGWQCSDCEYLDPCRATRASSDLLTLRRTAPINAAAASLVLSP